MFSIEVRFKAGDREVSRERFANLFIAEIFRGALSDAMAKLTPTPPLVPSSVIAPGKAAKTAPRVVSIPEATTLLGLRPFTVRAWIGRRKISAVRLGRRVVVPMEVIDDVLSRGLIPTKDGHQVAVI
jgi:hypothetical protein